MADLGEPSDGAPSPHCDQYGEEDAVVTMVHSLRIGRERPYCTGCGSPLWEYGREYHFD